jgi:glycosyltransferase involved in cell wall biosynthesis
VLPFRNQADHVEATVTAYAEALARTGITHELILVVNACTDPTPEVCRSLAARLAGVRVLESERGGWGLAVRLGLAAATGDTLCYTNSARTSPQDLVLMLLVAQANPGTVVKANRRVRESWRRRLGSLLYNLQCRMLFDLPYWDINGTPKVFPRRFSRLTELARDDDLIDLEFHCICRAEGYPVLEVPVLSTRRHGGSSTTGYRTAVRLYLGALAMWRDRSGRGK